MKRPSTGLMPHGVATALSLIIVACIRPAVPSPHGATRTGWRNLHGSFLGTPAAVSHGGELAVFTRNRDTTLGYYDPKHGTRSSLGGSLLSSPSVAPTLDGALAVVARSQSGRIEVNFMTPRPLTQSGFIPVGGKPPSAVTFTGDPMVAAGENPSLHVFTLGSDGNLWHAWQLSPSPQAPWSEWTSLGAPPGGLDLLARFVVLFLRDTGRLQLCALGSDGIPYIATQLAPGEHERWGEWSPAVQGGGAGETFLGGVGAIYSTRAGTPIFVGWAAQSGTFLYHAPCLQGCPGQWTLLPTPPYPPISAPVLIEEQGVASIVFVDTRLSVQRLQQSGAPGPQAFWLTWRPLGPADARFTGELSVIVERGSMSLFQRSTEYELLYCEAPPK